MVQLIFCLKQEEGKDTPFLESPSQMKLLKVALNEYAYRFRSTAH